MGFVNGSVVNVALPAIQNGLGATVQDIQWVLNGYALVLAALILVGGTAGDRFGGRRVFSVGAALFALASIACALAVSVPQLIAARVVQGIAGALLIPTSLSLLSRAYPEDERGRAIGTWAGAAALTSAAGPLVGGWLIDAGSWRFVFLVNLPLAALALAITARYMPAFSPEDETAPIDVPGALLATSGLAALTYGLIRGADAGLVDPLTLGALVAGIGFMAVFLVVEARSTAPMVPLRLFRNATFTGANLLTLFLYASLGSVMFLLPFLMIQVKGYSATMAGAAFLPFTLLVGGLSRWTGGLVDRVGARRPLVFGPLVTGAGFGLLAFADADASYVQTLLPGMTILGLGMAVSVAPLTTTVMSAVKDRETGIASGINNAVSRTAWLFSVAALGGFAVVLFGSSLAEELSRLSLSPDLQSSLLAQQDRLAALPIPDAVTGSTRASVQAAIYDSFLRSFRWTMACAVGLAVLSSVTAAIFIRPKNER